LSLVLVTAGLTCGTLFVVMRSAEAQMQREIEKAPQRSPNLQGSAATAADSPQPQSGPAGTHGVHKERGSQHHPGMQRKTRGNRNDCNCLFLRIRKGKVVALRTTTPTFPVAAAEELLRRSLKRAGKRGGGSVASVFIRWYGSRITQTRR